MANDSSLGSAEQLAFDLDSQKGITHFLASVRASALSAEQKNELRDLVFLYSHGGKDASVRISLEQKLRSYAITPLPVPAVPANASSFVFGTSRPAPDFVSSAPAAIKQSATIQPSTPPQPVTAIPVLPKADFDPVESIQPTSAPVTNQVPSPADFQPEEVVDTPASEFVPEPEPQLPVQPVDQTIPPTPTPTSHLSEGDFAARVQEIKAIVNEKVGNPVNLVDINNEVGREYMTALLGAMKSLNSGSSPAPAMQRLEAAFAQVQAILESSVVSATDQETVFQVPVTVQAQAEPSVSDEEAAPADLPVEVPTFEPATAAGPIMTEDAAVAETEPVVSKTSVAPEANDSAPAAPEAAPVIASGWGPHTDTVAVASDIPKATPLADAPVKPRRVDELPVASSLATSSVAGDPLFTSAVDDGLDQLLSEWVLFKKSGLFGTGPKGRQHPLFIKLSGLQIPLVLAGRFEGATQEIKQSITDYMNGWRYEQGLIYQPGETFEHYLRRVIKHILDLQNQQAR